MLGGGCRVFPANGQPQGVPLRSRFLTICEGDGDFFVGAGWCASVPKDAAFGFGDA